MTGGVIVETHGYSHILIDKLLHTWHVLISRQDERVSLGGLV